MKFNFFGNSHWSITELTPPWGNRPSIYWHIFNHLQDDATGLAEGGDELPDEEIVRGDSQFGWAAGALDGVLGHHAGTDEETAKKAQEVLRAFRDLTEKASDKNAVSLYSLLLENKTLGFIDPLLEAITNAEKLDHDRLRTIARWLAMEAADREVVKTAIAIIGLYQGNEDRDLLMTLGKHEEFTLYSVVALQNTQDDAEQALWQLAQHVRGWGRIQIIERIADTQDEYIKDWLLREGYQNEIMYEYTALVCAQTGELDKALKQQEIDNELLKGAGDLLSTLIAGRGGPAEGIESYEQGAEATENYLRHLSARKNSLDALVNADKIEQFLTDDEDGYKTLPESVVNDWSERLDDLLELIKSIKSQPGWREKVLEGLQAQERIDFWLATEAARVLGIDVWDNYFERIKRGEDYWWNVMQTDDPQRIDRVIEYAEETLPLAEIATGPANDLGLGLEFKNHQALDFVLQDLRRFPGKGWTLIKAGLQSPVVRNRNMAVTALETWDRKYWAEDTETILRKALESEPNDETSKLIRTVLDN